MNNISCEIIKDLLPLYCDGVCSEKSKEAILAHVQICDKCKEELRMLEIPIDIPVKTEEVEVAVAASKAWKKNNRKAFRKGIVMMILLTIIVAIVFLGSHYMETSTANDWKGLEKQLEAFNGEEHVEIQKVVQKGDCMAVSGYDDTGLWHLGIYTRDEVYSDRWKIFGSLAKVKPGKLANWNYETPEGDTILVCFGADLKENIWGYTFMNSGVTYTCPIDENGVLDFFFVLDSYDSRTCLEPIYEP